MSLKKEILKKVEKSFEKFDAYIEDIENKDLYKALSKLLDHFKERFYECPASTSTKFYGCYPGGLIVHSVLVTDILFKLEKLFESPKYSRDTLILVGCFHDVGKAGDIYKPYYIENDIEWQKEKGQLYRLNDDFVFVDPSVRSISLLNHFGAQLGSSEQQAILYHTGQNDSKNSGVRFREQLLTLLLQKSDCIAMYIEKGQIKLEKEIKK